MKRYLKFQTTFLIITNTNIRKSKEYKTIPIKVMKYSFLENDGLITDQSR